MNDDFWIGAVIWLVIALIGSLITIGILDGAGREARQHSESIPAQVVQLSPTSYLAEEDGPGPQEICHGTTDDGSSVNTAQKLEGIEASPVYIECARTQQWNVTGKRSEGFDDAAEALFTSPIYWLVFVVTLLVALAPGSVQQYNYWHRQRARLRQAKLEFEDKRRLLTDSWARREIDDLTFEDRLTELMEKAGIKELKEIKFK